jgi:hypothetical protein
MRKIKGRLTRSARHEFPANLRKRLREALENAGYRVPENYDLQIHLTNLNEKRPGNRDRGIKSVEKTKQMEIRIRPISVGSETGLREVLDNGESARPGESSHKHGLHPAEAELLRVLYRAESRPGWSFVPLRKFRDEILPQEHSASIRTEVEQRNVLRIAIEKKLILIGKVPNPKSPQFPVTTIRVNRLLSEVKAALGQSGDSDLDFRPVEIPGEPLSATILRERR